MPRKRTKKRTSGKLTLRQIQTLLSVYWHWKNTGVVSFSDPISDLGVSFVTLSGHLQNLYDIGLIDLPKIKARNMNFDDEIKITSQGKNMALNLLKSLEMNDKSFVSDVMGRTPQLVKLKPDFVDKRGLKTSHVSFSKTMNKFIEDNPVEPIMTSIAMYTELDNLLNYYHSVDKETYKKLAMVTLNLEIRNGRIASIAIPAAMRGQLPIYELKKIIGHSYSWMGNSAKRSITRYIDETMGLGLIQKTGLSIVGQRPTAVSTIHWLAKKTNSTFLNTVATAPKASLLAFHEIWLFPTYEELLNPEQADIDLRWARMIYDNTDKEIYRSAINEAVRILVDQTNIVERGEGGRLIPRIIMRKLKNQKDTKKIEKSFNKLVSIADENNTTAQILLAVNANPGITQDELYNRIIGANWWKFKIEKFEELIQTLAHKGLIHTARSSFGHIGLTRLYAFHQIPYILNFDEDLSDANAIFKGMEPYYLSLINDLFPKEEDRKILYEIFNKLLIEKEIDLEDVSHDDQTLARKLTILIHSLSAFLNVDESFSKISILDNQLSSVLMDVIQYSILTSNKALDMYAQVISDYILKDLSVRRKIEEDANFVKNTFLNLK